MVVAAVAAAAKVWNPLVYSWVVLLVLLL